MQTKISTLKGRSLDLEGVKQGNPVSSKLFTSLLEHSLLRQLNWSDKHGINTNSRRQTNMRFADGIMLFANSSGERG
jgi:hypothetical protein